MRAIFFRPFDGRLRAGWRLLLLLGALFLAGMAANGLLRLLPLAPMRGPEGQLVPVSLLVQALVLTGLVLGVIAAAHAIFGASGRGWVRMPATG